MDWGEQAEVAAAILERGSAAAATARPSRKSPPPPLPARRRTPEVRPASRLPLPAGLGGSGRGIGCAGRGNGAGHTDCGPREAAAARDSDSSDGCWDGAGRGTCRRMAGANNMVIHTARRHFSDSRAGLGDGGGMPHIVTSSVEHDSVRLPLEQLVTESLAEATFVPVSSQSGRVEVDDVLAAVRTTTCLVSIMLANNETGVIMPVAELSQRIRALNQRRVAEGLPRILVHTDAAQMIGKGRVDVQELGVDYLTIVGHKFYGPRIGALYVRGPGTATPLHPMLFGGGQERSFRPGTENTPMIAGLGQAAELVSKSWEAYEAHMRDVRDYLEARLEASFGKQRIHFNSHFTGSKRLCNTSNFSILGPGLQGRRVLSRCKTLLASVGAACHSEKGDRPSSVLLSCGIPYDVAQNALRLSVGRDTTRADVDLVVQDLVLAVAQLDQDQAP
ncbi:selenocysteine lyase isoform X3 [Falco peregrinus]|uniref:selenocysteine lyase isoform X3 n=1 Tax=Falco peregrinus TaxID=8954 RepID=UPI00247A2817|nr:selenocysteine lyase isoform X3 [Falco peregrinus]